MNILVLSDDFPPRVNGGPAVVAAQCASAYKQAGHDVTVITTVRSLSDAGQYAYEGITVHALHSDYHERWRAWRSLYNPSVITRLKPLIAAIRPDAVHAHNIHYHLSYHALKLAKLSGATVTLTAHDCMLFHYGKFTQFIDEKNLNVPTHFDYHISQWRLFRIYKWRYNAFRPFIIGRYLRFCDHLCAVSGRLKEALEANGIHGAEVVYNGIDPALWKSFERKAGENTAEKGASDANKKIAEFKKRHGIALDAPVVAFIGRLSHPKGGDQMVKAFARIVEKVPGAVLLAVGNKDQYGEKMLRLVEKLGSDSHRDKIVGKIIFTGWIGGEELRAAYAASDVIAFPSLCFDTFGMVNIEAMAMEKPLVATCFGGAPEVIEDGVTGTIVNPLNEKMLTDAIVGFLTDKNKAASFGKAGRARVVCTFTTALQAGRYLSLFKK